MNNETNADDFINYTNRIHGHGHGHGHYQYTDKNPTCFNSRQYRYSGPKATEKNSINDWNIPLYANKYKIECEIPFLTKSTK